MSDRRPERLATRETPAANPLDLLEQIVAAQEWAFERRNTEEMAVEVKGKWCDYTFHFSWAAEISAMHFFCAFDMKVPAARKALVHELLALANEKLWLGHFGIWTEENTPVFRHSVLLRGARGASVESLEDMMDIALTECERFYPAFQFVLWGGKRPAEALEAAMLDCAGEA
jgi:hypothetical protein